MPTSGSTNFSVTSDDLVNGALRLLGVIGESQTATTQQLSEGREALNYLVKAWENEGVPIWAIKSYDITLTASQSFRIGLSQTINTPKPLKIYQAFLRDSNNIDTPLTSLSQQQYQALSNKLTTGRPVQYYYDSQRDYGDLYVYQVPDTTYVGQTLRIFYQRPIEDFDAGTDNPDLPQEFLRALKFNLAAELAFEYGYPLQESTLLHQKAEKLKQEAFSFNVEESSMFFQVNRMGY